MNKELLEKIHAQEHYPENVECLEKHLSEYFKDAKITVFHEMLSLDFHLDVYYIKPKESPYDILITSGMSLLAMNVSEQIENKEDYQFAELMLLVPKSTVFSDMPSDGKGDDWLIEMLKETARFPHHYDTWITEGHTLQATSEMDAYSTQTEFVGCVLLPSASFDSEFTELQCKGKKINIYNIFPLYRNELEYKIANGYNAFFDLLIEANSSDVFNNNRANLLAKKDENDSPK